MFAIAFALFWIILAESIGLLYGGIFLFFIFLSSYWAWIWGYMGPAENYAMFGTSIFLFAFIRLINLIKENSNNRSYDSLLYSTILLIGSLIAIGSKENFLILSLPLIYIIYLIIKKRIINFPLITSLTIVLSYSIFVLVGIYLGLKKAGGDVYGQNIGFVERVRLSYDNLAIPFEHMNILGILAAIAIAFLTIYLLRSRKYLKFFKSVAFNFLSACLVLFTLYSSQVFFYNGNFPPTTLRYSFPGMIALPVFWLAALFFLFSTLRIVGFNKHIEKQTKNALFTVLFTFVLINGYQDTKAFLSDNVEKTNVFSSHMAGFYNYLGNNKDEPIVFDSYSIWNVEPIASVRAYLLANNIKNPMYLRLNYPTIEENDPQGLVAYKVSKFLNNVSANGGCAGLPERNTLSSLAVIAINGDFCLWEI